ncbi:MAG: acyl-CoA dehydrogenase [Alphaproteobacteria bacterium]|nr:acyl-CoA dehydrogenase [Alphaproteobacteria bacterium]MBF0129525.1 acyl-CoA dehydrogenase [Alphaproteobacteria bacterium]
MSEKEVNYSDWIGSKEEREEDIVLTPAHALLATLDDTTTVLRNGDKLPPLWHWLFFLPRAPMSQIGGDGHPKRGGFLPPVALPRRMFAGARMTFPDSLIIGRPATRKGEVIAVSEKKGGSGTLVFVTVRYRIEQDGRLCVEEEQDIVYREPGGKVPAPVPAADVPRGVDGAWVKTVTPDPVLLFRFSSLTFNSHRIHYDRPYAMNEENYPGLMVHGPLNAMLLMDLCRNRAGRPVVGYSFRGKAPVFDLNPYHLIGRPSGDKVELEVQGPDGASCMSATAELG